MEGPSAFVGIHPQMAQMNAKAGTCHVAPDIHVVIDPVPKERRLPSIRTQKTMIRSLLPTLSVLCLLANCAGQDLHGFALNGYIRGHIPLDIGGGSTMHVCDRNFGYDSSYVELLATDAGQATIASASYRLPSFLTFLNGAAKLNDGVLVCGSSYNYQPMVLKASNARVVQWCKGFSDLQNSQDQVVSIVPRGADYTLYTYPGGTYSHHVYRIEGQSSGTTFNGIDISAAANFRVYRAIPTADPMVQLVCGTGSDDADPGPMHTMLMKTDASGAQWMKLYDMGVPGVQIQDLYGVIQLADGNFLCSGYYTTGGSSFQGVLLKVDPTGAVIWCKQYTDVSGGLFFNQASELGSGELLVAGINSAYQGLLIKLDATGTPISTGLFPNDRLTTFQRIDGQLSVHGPYTLLELDEAGNGCGLSPATNVTATSFTPTVTAITVGNSAFTPTTSTLATYSRTPALQWSTTCTFSGVEEGTIGDDGLRPYPVPTAGRVMLGEPGALLPNTRVRLLTLAGQLVREMPYGSGVDLEQEAAGVYVIEVPEAQRRILVTKEKVIPAFPRIY